MKEETWNDVKESWKDFVGNKVFCNHCHHRLTYAHHTKCDLCQKFLHAHCAISLDITKDPDHGRTYYRLYGRKLVSDLYYLSESPIIKACPTCNETHIRNFLSSLPPQDLPLLINFPWKNIQGTHIYKEYLASQNPFK